MIQHTLALWSATALLLVVCCGDFGENDVHWSVFPGWRGVLLWMHPTCTLIARFMGPTWGPPGDDRTQVGPMLVPWILLSGYMHPTHQRLMVVGYCRYIMHPSSIMHPSHIMPLIHMIHPNHIMHPTHISYHSHTVHPSHIMHPTNIMYPSHIMHHTNIIHHSHKMHSQSHSASQSHYALYQHNASSAT